MRRGGTVHWKARSNLRYVRDVVKSFELEDDYVLIGPRGESLIGMPRSRLLDRVGDSAFLLNIMGYLRDEDVLGRAAKRVFLDIDPGFGQFWEELGLHRPFTGYDSCVTIGLNIGRPDCTIPTCGLDWIVTPQPVVLEWWPPSDVPGESFTTSRAGAGLMDPWNSRENPTASACTSSADSWTCPDSPAVPSSWPSPFTRPKRET